MTIAYGSSGAPQFDAVATMLPDFAARRRELRARLGVADTEVLVLIAGQPRGTHEMLQVPHSLNHKKSAEGLFNGIYRNATSRGFK